MTVDVRNAYPDGIGTERCVVCGSALRQIDGARVVAIRLSDVEWLARLLDDINDFGQSKANEVMKRLVSAAGRSVAQMIDAPIEE